MTDDTGVADYLRAHPDFFERHPEVLEQLQLPHQSGAAISLIERQVSVLRERNLDMRQRLNALLTTARDNDKLFEKTKRLVLALLEAHQLSEVVDALYHSLAADFDVPFYNLVLLGEATALPASGARVVGLDEAQQSIGALLRGNRAICGILRREELQFLFGDDAARVGSVAAVPLYRGRVFGVLAIGHGDPNHYRSSMGTLFLSYIAEVLNRVCPRLLG
ncbi:MAG: hypothetical protein AMXMBFR26_14400 [Porticoccaceae bacterium]